MAKVLLAADLPELGPVVKQADGVSRAHHVSLEDFLKLFDEEVHGKIRGAALADGATHVLCMENLDLWSSNLGHRTALIVGEKQTWTLQKALGTPYFRLGDVPSRFQYPVAYASVAAFRDVLPGQETAGEVKT